jgi:hypothetical protein
MTVPLVAATFFGANIYKTCRFLHEYGYIGGLLRRNMGAKMAPYELALSP